MVGISKSPIQVLWSCFELDFMWFLRYYGIVVKKENVGFLEGICQNFCKNPCSCFGYRLSYTHPNQLIPIVK